MSLRRPRGESWEKPLSAQKLEADLRSTHSLVKVGLRGCGCACGAFFSTTTYSNRREASMAIRMHQRAVIESLEQVKNGVDRYE